MGENFSFLKKTDKGYIPITMEGSFNEIAKNLGYESNQYYCYYNFNSNDIMGAAFKIFTTDILFIMVRGGLLDIQDRDVRAFLKEFEFSDEYNTSQMESDLEEGIYKENLSIDFLAEAMDIPHEEGQKDGILVSDKFKYRLYFKDGFLIKFESSDGYNSAATYMLSSMPSYFRAMKNYAEKYWEDDKQGVIEELNLQCDAFLDLPNGMQNIYLKDFSIDGHLYNFKIVQILYYGDTCTWREFKDICHGEFKYHNEQTVDGITLLTYKYKCGFFVFSDKGLLVNTFI